MSISEAIYTVYVDGQAAMRGLTYQEAHAEANAFANGVERLKSSDQRRAPHVEVRKDQQMLREEQALYRWAKQGGR